MSNNLSKYESKLMNYLKLYEKDLPLTAYELFKKINMIEMVKKGLIGSLYTTVRGNNFVSKYFLLEEDADRKILDTILTEKNYEIPLSVEKRYEPPSVSIDFIKPNYGDELILKCPVCKELYLHHHNIYIINRRNEDMDGELVFVDTNNNIIKQEIKAKDIVGRRDAMYISFYCEYCDKSYSLEIHQHKGNTCLSWVDLNINLRKEKVMNKLLKLQEELKKKQEELNSERMVIWNNLKFGKEYLVEVSIKELERQGFEDDAIFMLTDHSSSLKVKLIIQIIKLSIELKSDDTFMFIITGKENRTGLSVLLQLEDFID